MLVLTVRNARIYRTRTFSSSIRTYSSEQPYRNFNKVKALPFHLTPESAQKRMSNFLQPVISEHSPLYSMFAGLVLGQLVRPVRFSAAYFPAWVVNAQVEMDIVYSGIRRRCGIVFRNSYLPGSHVAPLCTSPFWNPTVEALVTAATPEELPLFNESLLTQHGQDVQCIPYTTSPFAILETDRDSLLDIVVTQNVSLSPASFDVKIFSASPVLLPIYLGMYETLSEDDQRGSLTAWMPAHRNASPNIMTENLVGKIPEERLDALELTLSKLRGKFNRYDEVYTFDPDNQTTVSTVGLVGQKHLPNFIRRYVHEFLSSSDDIDALFDPLDNDDDPRIRTADADETMQLDLYFKNENEVAITKRILEDVSNPNSKVKVIDLSFPSKGTAHSRDEPLRARLETLEKRKEKLTPRWWKEWEASQQRRSEPSTGEHMGGSEST